MPKTGRRSKILFNDTISVPPPRFQSDEPLFLFEQFQFWSFERMWNREREHANFFRGVIDPKLIQKNLSARVVEKLGKEIQTLITTRFPSSKHIKKRFNRKKQIHQVENITSSLNGLKFRKGVISRLEDRIRRIVSCNLRRIKLIDLTETYEGDLGQISIHQGLSFAKIASDVRSIIEKQDIFDRKVRHMISFLELAKAVQNVTENHPQSFKTIKFVEDLVRKKYPDLQFSISSLYRIFRMQGFRWKKMVTRANETDRVKEARLHFLKEFAYYLKNAETVVLYFDWTSFSQHNFQTKSWSSLGKKSIASDYYHYAKLHLLSLLGQDGIIAMQYVTGTLNSPVIFDFLFKTLEKITKQIHEIGKDLAVVLDNSPLNHSKAVKNLAWKMEFTLLFTAPNSSFLNPIELLFAKLKAGLKTKVTASK